MEVSGQGNPPLEPDTRLHKEKPAKKKSKSEQEVEDLAKQLADTHLTDSQPKKRTLESIRDPTRLVSEFLPPKNVLSLELVSKHFASQASRMRKGRGDILVQRMIHAFTHEGTEQEKAELQKKCLEAFKREGEHITSLVLECGPYDPIRIPTEFLRQALACCPNLQVLNLEGWRRDDDDFNSRRSFTTTSLPQLQVLVLNSPQDVDIQILKCEQLRYFRAAVLDPRLTDEGLHALAKYASALETIHLSEVRQVTDSGVIDLLQKASVVKYLDLYGTRITDTTLHFIAQKPLPLEELGLTSCPNITPDGISACLSRVQPRVLSLRKTAVDDKTLHDIAKTDKRLEVLIVSECSAISDDGLRAVMNARPLRCLGCPKGVTDELFLQESSSSKTLEILDISSVFDRDHFFETDEIVCSLSSASLDALADQGAPLKVILMPIEYFESVESGQKCCMALERFPQLKAIILLGDILEGDRFDSIKNSHPQIFAKMFDRYQATDRLDLFYLLKFMEDRGGVTFSSLEKLGLIQPQPKASSSQ